MDRLRRSLLGGGTAAGITAALFGVRALIGFRAEAGDTAITLGGFTVTRSDAEWKALLTPEQYAVLRHEGTEHPYTSPLNGEHRDGTFTCAGCDLDLFESKTKFDSHTGWPSFYQPIRRGAVGETQDRSAGMVRTEVHCSRCGGHLGHVFPDGPAPTGLRYCMNGVAMKFRPTED